MSRTPNDDRRTMPPLPAAGMRPTSHHEPSDQAGSKPDEPQGTSPSGLRSETGTSAQRANPINMALLELQEEMPLDEEPPVSAPLAPPAPPSAPASTSLPPLTPRPTELPEARIASPPPETPTARERATSAEPRSGPETVSRPAAPPSSAMSSTSPIAAPLPRPSERPAQPLPTAPQPVEGGLPTTSILLGGAIVWFLFGMLGAWAYDHLLRKPDRPAESTAASTDSPTDESAPAQLPAPALSAEVLDPLKTRLGELGEQVDEFEKQIAEAPKGTAATDLTPVRQQLDAVAASVNGIEPLSKQLQGVSERMEGLETTIKGLKGDLGALQASATEPARAVETPSVSTPAPTPAPGAVESETPRAADLTLEDANAQAGGLSEGVALFKAGKYQEAYHVFEKLETTNPNDARVWYFAALSHGWATNDFKEGGKTLSLVQKGIEREKAGTPKSAEIDAMFQDLSAESGKTWLAFKRKAGLK